MKKQVLIFLVSMVPAMGFAKVSDFNDLISENSKAQKDLHSNVQNNVDQARDGVAAKNVRQRIVFVEKSGGSYTAPTRKDLLSFEKEKTYHRASDDKKLNRLANEISSLND